MKTTMLASIALLLMLTGCESIEDQAATAIQKQRGLTEKPKLKEVKIASTKIGFKKESATVLCASYQGERLIFVDKFNAVHFEQGDNDADSSIFERHGSRCFDDLAEGARKTAELEKANKEADKISKGFHCLSGWNGSQSYVVKAVKLVLNDPDSFDHVETRVAPVANGRHGFAMKYRAKNAFGGTITNNATGSYSNKDCSDVSIVSAQ